MVGIETKVDQLDEMLDNWDKKRSNQLTYEYEFGILLTLYIRDNGWSIKRYTSSNLILSNMRIKRSDETEVGEIAEAIENLSSREIEQTI